MTAARRSMITAALAVVITAALAGCSGADPGPVPSAPAGSPTGPAATSPAPTGASTSPTPTTVENSYTPPARTPGRPDASTAGSLSAKSFPNPVLRFRGTVVDPDEGEYNPNGTWVHAIDGQQAAFESIPQCRAVRLSDVPVPRSALSGTYRGPGDAPGNALGLQFADDAAAERFLTLYATQLRACPSSGGGMPMVTDLAVTGTTITGRRTYGPEEKWSEMIGRRGPVVIMIILADGHAASPATLAEIAADL